MQNKYRQPPIVVPKFRESEGFYTTAQRSEMMRRIKTRHTKPEVALRKALWHLGFRYRCHVKHLPGCPDLVFKGLKVAIFVDGDFWHGYNWHLKKHEIKSNAAFWIPKIERNIQRDQMVNAQLEQMGWTVVRVWEHELKKAHFGATVYRIVQLLHETAGVVDFLEENL